MKQCPMPRTCHAKRRFRPQNVPKVPRVPQNGHSSKSEDYGSCEASFKTKDIHMNAHDLGTESAYCQCKTRTGAGYARTHPLKRLARSLYEPSAEEPPRRSHTQRLYNYNRVWFFPTSKASAVLPRERSNTHHVMCRKMLQSRARPAR